MQRSTISAGVDAAWTYFQFRILSYLKSCRGSVLPTSGLEILGRVLEAIVNANSTNSWRRIFIIVAGHISEELIRLSAEDERLYDQVQAQLPLHHEQSEEIGWAAIPRGILHERNKRRKALLAVQIRTTRIKTRRVLHHRALWYIHMLEETKRGQLISYWDILPASGMFAYFILLWLIDAVFALVWALLGLFESLVVDPPPSPLVQ
ncbi:hypothetical protein FGLOB1_8480 [Fusarium globosum]|uniref:Uncharacterized protein n=1 Tax=Fusarium globosum TaxID=78864 RepID=A0A8H5Y2I3_9HYPO|nr:hypothetical protein FGLOB1_8480 [Fusarium globosum]